jgi:hypothetical protein
MPETGKKDQLPLMSDGGGSAGKGALGDPRAKNGESALEPVSLRSGTLR